jgi:hypothetical protein
LRDGQVPVDDSAISHSHEAGSPAAMYSQHSLEVDAAEAVCADERHPRNRHERAPTLAGRREGTRRRGIGDEHSI